MLKEWLPRKYGYREKVQSLKALAFLILVLAICGCTVQTIDPIKKACAEAGLALARRDESRFKQIRKHLIGRVKDEEKHPFAGFSTLNDYCMSYAETGRITGY